MNELGIAQMLLRLSFFSPSELALSLVSSFDLINIFLILIVTTIIHAAINIYLFFSQVLRIVCSEKLILYSLCCFNLLLSFKSYRIMKN